VASFYSHLPTGGQRPAPTPTRVSTLPTNSVQVGQSAFEERHEDGLVHQRRLISAACVATALAGLFGAYVGREGLNELYWEARAHQMGLPAGPAEKYVMIAGGDAAEVGAEAFEAATAAGQWAEARTAPGIVNPGAYGDALSQLSICNTPLVTGPTSPRVPYDSDDPRYRDPRLVQLQPAAWAT